MPLPFNSTITYQRQTPSVGAVGGNNPTWAARLSDVLACRMPVSANNSREFSREDLVATDEWATETDVAATSQDRVIDADGVYYEVLGYKRFNSPFSSRVLYITITGRRNQ